MQAINHPPPFYNPQQSPKPRRRKKVEPAHCQAHVQPEINSPQHHSIPQLLHTPNPEPKCFGPIAVSGPQCHRYDINNEPFRASHDRYGHASPTPSTLFAMDRCTNPPAHSKSQCLYMSPMPSLQISDILSHRKSESFSRIMALSNAKTTGSWQKRVNLQPNIKL